jgi:hypothetical protein
VLWLVETYELWEHWPACWNEHPGLVEELTAMWVWHQGLDTDKTTDAPGAVAWHAALWRFVDGSVASITRRCPSAHHEAAADIAEAHAQMAREMEEGYRVTLEATISRRRILDNRPAQP